MWIIGLLVVLYKSFCKLFSSSAISQNEFVNLIILIITDHYNYSCFSLSKLGHGYLIANDRVLCGSFGFNFCQTLHFSSSWIDFKI